MIACSKIQCSLKYLTLFLLLLLSKLSFAQETVPTKVFITKDGSEIVGQMRDSTAEYVTVFNEIVGEIRFKTSEIESIRPFIESDIEHIEESSDWFVPPVPSVNFLTETAIGMKKGDIYYQNVLLFGNKFGFGISDHFSINAGFEWLSTFNGHAPTLLIAPKYTFTDLSSTFHIGIGSNLLYLPYNSGSSAYVASLYVISTVGDTDLNFTFGIGGGATGDDFYESPIFQLGGFGRIAKNFAIVVDALTIADDESDFYYVGSSFLRYMTSKFNIDLGYVFSHNFSDGIPMANFSIRL